MTQYKRQILRVEMEDWEGNAYHAEFDNFKVGSEQTKYQLTSIGRYSGTAGQYEMKTDPIVCLRQTLKAALTEGAAIHTTRVACIAETYKPFKNLGANGAWAYPRTAQFF